MFDARLQVLLGSTVKDASYEQFLTLIGNEQAAEGWDLEYKGELYRKGTEGAGELAKDVAAMANAGGGNLIIGLHENRATSVPCQPAPVALTDRLRKDYREWLALRVDPPVQCDIHFIPDSSADGAPQGLVVISVPPSPLAPHTVVGVKDLRDGTHRFPVRNDNTTTFMNLSQVKQSIAVSESRAAGRRAVVEQAESEVFAERIRAGGVRPALTVTVVPDLSGLFPINSSSFGAFRERAAGEVLAFHQIQMRNIGVGPRRFTAADGDHCPNHVAHFHADGSAAWTAAGPTVPAYRVNAIPDSPVPSWHSDRVVMLTLAILQYLTRHVVGSGRATGTATVRVILNGDGAQPLAREASPGVPQVCSPKAPEIAVGESSILLDGAARSGSELVRAAASVLADLFQNFAVVEARQLTLEGQLNLAAWSPRYREELSAWAKRTGVETLTAP